MKKKLNHQELLKSYRSVQMTPARNGEYWKEEERELLKKRYQEGIGISEIALELQRSESGVFQQLFYLNVIRTPGERRPRCKEAECRCGKCKLRDCCPYRTKDCKEG